MLEDVLERENGGDFKEVEKTEVHEEGGGVSQGGTE